MCIVSWHKPLALTIDARPKVLSTERVDSRYMMWPHIAVVNWRWRFWLPARIVSSVNNPKQHIHWLSGFLPAPVRVLTRKRYINQKHAVTPILSAHFITLWPLPFDLRVDACRGPAIEYMCTPKFGVDSWSLFSFRAQTDTRTDQHKVTNATDPSPYPCIGYRPAGVVKKQTQKQLCKLTCVETRQSLAVNATSKVDSHSRVEWTASVTCIASRYGTFESMNRTKASSKHISNTQGDIDLISSYNIYTSCFHTMMWGTLWEIFVIVMSLFSKLAIILTFS